MKKLIMMAAVVGVMSFSLMGCSSNEPTDNTPELEETTEASPEEETIEEETSEEDTSEEETVAADDASLVAETESAAN